MHFTSTDGASRHLVLFTHPLSITYYSSATQPFEQITNLTDVAEGTIVRVITRLDETCREVRDAARVIGDASLMKKMEEAQIKIKRDSESFLFLRSHVFSSSAVLIVHRRLLFRSETLTLTSSCFLVSDSCIRCKPVLLDIEHQSEVYNMSKHRLDLTSTCMPDRAQILHMRFV